MQYKILLDLSSECHIIYLLEILKTEGIGMKIVTKIFSILSLSLLAHATWAAPSDNVQKFLDKLNANPGKPMEQMSPNEARDVLTNAQKQVNVDLSGVDVQHKMISVNGKPLKLTIVRPIGKKELLPAFMFFHGGGWVIGDYPTHQRFIRDLVVNSGVAAIYVDYSRSPEARYPVAINQAYGATKWVAEHSKELNIDANRLGVVGNSVGGNMATVVAMMAKDKGGPAIKYQILFWPVTDANFDTGSYQQFAQGYFLTRNMMKWFWDNYLPDVNKRHEIYASPLQANSDQLKGMPPALFIVAGNDVLHDEGVAYANKLKSAGVDVDLQVYPGTIHDFGLLNPLAQDSETRAALKKAGDELRGRLQ